MLRTIVDLLQVAITVVSVFIAIYSFIRKKKNSRTAEETTTALVEQLRTVEFGLEVVKKLPEIISKAESIFGAGFGAGKLQYCLNEIRAVCADAGIKYNEEDYLTQIEKILKTPQSKL